MKLKRFMAFVLSLAMVATSSSFGALSVYAAEDELLIVDDDTSSDVLLDEKNDSSVITDASDGQLKDETVSQDDDQNIIYDDSNLLYDESSDDGTLIDNSAEDTVFVEDKDVDTVGVDETVENYQAQAEEGVSNQYQSDVRVGDFIYTIYDKERVAILTKWEPETPTDEMDVTIPLTVDIRNAYYSDGTKYKSRLIDSNYTRDVVAVGVAAFAEVEEHRLKSVSFSKPSGNRPGVRMIAAGAFMNCTLLTSIEFPENMTTTAKDVYGDGCIDDYAFAGCTSLKVVNLPKKLDAIGACVFADCASLTSIEIPKDWDTTVVHEIDKEKTYSLVENTEIKEGPFSSCETLTTITFEVGAISIPDCLLANCDSIQGITIPSSLKSIGKKAFYGCDNLKSLEISADSQLVEIGDWAFNECVSLTDARLPKYTKTIGQGAFIGCTALKSTTIPVSIGEVGNRAYLKCVNLETVVFGE